MTAALASPLLVRGHVGHLPGLFDEIAIDLFAGGGGMSMAWEIATGRCVDEAVNHDADAIWMHTANHPNTRHWREDVWAVNPLEVAAGRPVGWLHGSPDCTHFSMARGGKPVRKEIRGLAWVILKWAAALRPRLITMENVREFLTWGPLIQKKHGRRRWAWECTRAASRGEKKVRFTIEGPHADDGSSRSWRAMLVAQGYSVEPLMIPDPSRRAVTFDAWKSQLEDLGYVVETKVLDAADFGAPTHRKRLFIVARCDGVKIQWPEKTHGDHKHGRTANDIGHPEKRVDATYVNAAAGFERNNHRPDGDPLHSRRRIRMDKIQEATTGRHDARIKPFRTAAECIDHSTPCPSIFTRKKELAENTLRRIVRGLVKFVINDPSPYIVNVDHGGPDFRGQRLNQPLPTICQDHGFALVVPSFIPYGWQSVGFGDLVAPHLIQFNGEKGGEARGQRIDLPINTLPTENRFGLVTPFLYDRYGERAGQDPRARRVDRPIGTLTGTANGANLVAAYMVRHRFGEVGWTSIRNPLQTICAQGNHFSLITPYLVEYANSSGGGIRHALRPAPTVTAYPKGGSWAIATPFLYKNVIGETPGQRCDVPLHVITSVHNKFQLVAPLAVKFYKSGIVKPVTSPLDAITHRDRFGFAACYLTKLRGSGGWNSLVEPIDTICAGATTFGMTAAWMVKHYGGNYEGPGIDVRSPLDTITAVDHHAVAYAWGTKMHGTSFGFDVHDAMPTVTAGGNHLYLTSAWGTHLRGMSNGFDMLLPTPTLTSKGAHLVETVARMIDGPTEDPQINAGFWRVHELLKRFLGPDAPLPIVNKDGQQYLIYDIGMRMLSPRELLNAQFGPELAKDYILTGTRESQVAKIGNSVPPYLGAAVIRANWNAVQGDDADREVAA